MIFNNVEIPKYLYLTEAIDDKLILNNDFRGINNSYNLTTLEYIYHIASGYKPFNSQFMGDCWFFFDPCDLKTICLYAHVKFRFAYAGAAREQLNYYCHYNPLLKQLLQIRSAYNLKAKIQKYNGTSFKDDTIIEYSGRNRNEFLMEKQYWESFLEEKYH
jgi:hypothetical protein